MKKIFCLTIMLLLSVLYAEVAPAWVDTYLNNQSYEHKKRYYFVAVSSLSTQKAETLVRQKFSRYLSLEIEGGIKSESSEKNGQLDEKVVRTVTEHTATNQSGLPLTACWEDKENSFYYVQLNYSAAQIIAKAQEISELQLRMQEAITANRRDELSALQAEEIYRCEILALKEKRFADFTQYEAPGWLINLPTAHRTEGTDIIVGGDLDPFQLQSLGLISCLGPVEISGRVKFLHASKNEAKSRRTKLTSTDARAKIIAWDTTNSKLYNIKLAAGARYYNDLLEHNRSIGDDAQLTWFAVLDISFSKASSYLSVYADGQQLGIGSNTFLWYSKLQNHLQFVQELRLVNGNKIYEDDEGIVIGKNPTRELLTYSPGIRLQSSRSLAITVAYEDNRLFTLCVELRM